MNASMSAIYCSLTGTILSENVLAPCRSRIRLEPENQWSLSVSILPTVAEEMHTKKSTHRYLEAIVWVEILIWCVAKTRRNTWWETSKQKLGKPPSYSNGYARYASKKSSPASFACDRTSHLTESERWYRVSFADTVAFSLSLFRATVRKFRVWDFEMRRGLHGSPWTRRSNFRPPTRSVLTGHVSEKTGDVRVLTPDSPRLQSVDLKSLPAQEGDSWVAISLDRFSLRFLLGITIVPE